ncbi:MULTISPECIES: citramalate synthase [unclassified Leptolyngbya]|uniref:citramalate synthase n=1 Tax=unclassified Leptolyngbya TaxID=2650499 RepID=UPI00168A2498|nr:MULTISPECIES: citramalate synthase [unclassified Leptolyngbya]MBD1911521.1 citramalate synthase [Leptolyngbya sp. FACHB-8]MBD2155238.1 citramalate synthase [Leptolyngbya sp. FACHB-16]
MTTQDSAPNTIWIYDTTLRDGAQREGLSLSLEDKLRIARQLDQLGIPFIEGGWPGANPKDVQFFWQLREEPLSQAEVVAFCATRRPGRTAESDPMLQPILSAGTRWVTIFGKSWDLHVTEGLKTTLEENLAMITDTLSYLRSQGRRVIYDAEHWFDGYKANPEYALETLKAAIAGGAEWLTLCDTNGGTLPHEVGEIVQKVSSFLQNSDVKALSPDASIQVQIGIHTHNDSGTAVANALTAVMDGARMVQGTINGYGERCGNANLCTLIPNLQLKLGYSCITPNQLATLTDSSRLISEIVNLAPDDHAPYVGLSAFAHKGGIHVSAVERNPITYEHISPDSIGNRRRIVISDQAGLSNVLSKARSFGIELDKDAPTCRQLLQNLKNLENEGYQFEAAEASFELLMREALGQRESFFNVKGFHVYCQLLPDSTWGTDSRATIKVIVGGEEILEAGEGNGPVSALDSALRRALKNFYPEIVSFHLTDYKVRILDGTLGTSAKTRVLVESSNGHQRWTTVGVSTNIIEASYQAVVEGLEYGLMLQHRAKVALETSTVLPE